MSKGVRLGVMIALLACLAAVLAIPAVRIRVLAGLKGEPVTNGRPAHTWVLDLYSSDVNTREAAKVELDEMGDAAWSRNLGNSNSRVRVWAFEQSLRHRTDPEGKQAQSREAVLALETLLSDPDPIVRHKAALALLVIPPGVFEGIKEMDRTISVLAGTLKDQDAAVRETASTLLARQDIAKQARAALPALAEATRDPDSTVRTNAARTLGEMGAEARDSVPALVQSLGDLEDNVRAVAAEALGAIGLPASRPAIPELRRVAQGDESEDVRTAARGALAKLGAATVPGKK